MSTDYKKLQVCPKITDTSVTDDKKIKLQWTAVPMAEKYAVMRSEKSNGEYTRVAWAKETSYIDKSVKPDLTYWYRIVAWKALANKKNSKKTSPFAAKVVSDIPAPSALKAKAAKDGKIILDWSCPEGVDTFIINRRNDFFDQIVPVAEIKGNRFTDKDVVSGQIYHYSVQSKKDQREGNFSGEISAIHLDCGEIVHCKALNFKNIELKARIVAGAEGYIFERSDDGESFTEVFRSESGVDLRYTDKAPKHFKVYHYRVRAFKTVGEKLFISEPSPCVKIKSK